jgi:hypothetical protein
MATSPDTIPDRFERLGEPQGSVADDLSSTPIGGSTIPAPEARLTYYRINGGLPAPAP